MFFVKNSFVFCFVFAVIFCGDWVFQYKEKVFYEEDFYSYFPKGDWVEVEDNQKRESLFFEFVKERASVYEAELLGLHLNPKVSEKLSGRFNRLLVNEYYMREFLGSVVPDKALAFCKQNLNKSIFVNHILIEKENIVLADSLLGVIKGGGGFDVLAPVFSKDPSAFKNNGALGWITVGQTVPKFQDFVFGLCVGCVGVVETDFGLHVVRVDSIKNSPYSSLEKEEFDDFAFRFATGYIEEPLKLLAAKHDSSLLEGCGVSLNKDVLGSFVESVKQQVLESSSKSRTEVDFVGLLGGLGGVALYKNNVLSGKWFSNKFSGPFYKNVFFDSVDLLIEELRLVLLRDFVVSLALGLGVDKGFSFEKQFFVIRSEILKKEYMGWLAESVSPPSKKEVEDFYFKNEKEFFVNKKTGQPFGVSSSFGSAKAMLLKEKQDAAKQSFLDMLKGPDVVLNKGWLYVD